MRLASAVALSLALAAGSAGAETPVGPLHGTHRPALEPFPLRDVRLLDGPFQDAQRRGLDVLLRLDPERLLHSFRRNAGLPSNAKPYGGWEAPDVELRGHSLGHYLSACALMYEATGDERLKARALSVVAELRRVQQALPARGMHEGFLSAFPESFFDRLEARERVWAPYYTLHKILAGLLDVQRATGDGAALEIAKGIADWVSARAGPLSEARWQAMLETEFGGMQEALTALYAVTHDPEQLQLARRFDHHAVFDPLARGEDPLDGLHANTQIPKAIGAALDCSLTGEPRYCAVAETFWQRVARHRSYAIGGNSDDEHFPPVASLARHLSESTAETCNTYNMLKLTWRLFLREPQAERMEFYERGLLNHILASQDPVTAGVCYYVPLTAGAFRTYSKPEDSFWCCVGTGMENPARYGEAIYARAAGELDAEPALFVNLFVASRLRWPDVGLVLSQETRFPEDDRTRLTFRLERPLRLALRLRRPAWATRSFRLRINGAAQPAPGRAGSYLTLDREWRDGDVVELQAPMSLQLEPAADDPTVAALRFGPLVLAADLGTAGLDATRRYGPAAPELRLEELPPRPALVAASPTEALARIERLGDASFRTRGLGRPADLTLVPFYRLHDRRYAVYLDLLDDAAYARRAARAGSLRREEEALDERTLDQVRAGVAADEQSHRLAEQGSDTGLLAGRPYRSARSGAAFSYVLQGGRSAPSALRVTYWGGETRRHRFEVLVDDRPLAMQSLFDDAPGETFAVEYPLPSRAGSEPLPLRVGFRPLPGSSVGAVFDLRLVRAPATEATARR